ncbi:MCE family protein [Persicimonas caeni]|uniref:MCE family protein n=1 Tax=Persicimonas caeni TaxID=2292766 RepID=A0A4Y6Q2C0_PERCE|nr:MlaD family protein [Persicimonas caeni]QDG54734.1 MCE family protein [Persicimonas caeni]QED35955.1 MCE family protein [Persicimonas caeni]
MQNKETAIEVKVGALVLFSLGLLVAFVLVLGDFSFSDEFTFHVDFENAGGLKPGADVAIAGINVGNVERLEFQPNKGNEGQPAVEVRATLRISPDYADAVRQDSEFFITRRGVLGEPYIEIETNSFDAPQVEEGAVLRGVQPPRMDVIVAKATELLDTLDDLLSDPDIPASELIGNAASLMGNLDKVIVDNRQDIDGTIEGARMSTQEAAKLLQALNYAVEEGETLRRTLADAQATAANARAISSKVNGQVDPVIADVRAATENARKVSETAARVLGDNEQKLDESIANVHASTEDLKNISEGASTVVGRIESGEGTVGQLLADREMYDDMKELLRTIKRRPWKIIWKE